MGFAFAIFAFFMYSFFFIRSTFWLPAMGLIALLKIFPFSYAAADAFFALAMFMLAYLLFRMKKSVDKELENKLEKQIEREKDHN